MRQLDYDCSYLNGNHPLNQLSARSSCTGNNPLCVFACPITTQRKGSWLVCKGGFAYVHTYRPPIRPHHRDTSETRHHFQAPKNQINEVTSSRIRRDIDLLARATRNDRCCAARLSGIGAAVSRVAKALRLTSSMSSKSGRNDRACRGTQRAGTWQS